MKPLKEQEKSEPNYQGTQLPRDRPSESRESGVRPEGRKYHTMLTRIDVEMPRNGPDKAQGRIPPRNENQQFRPQEKPDPSYQGTQLNRDRPNEPRPSSILQRFTDNQKTKLTGRDIEIPRDGPDREQPRTIPRNEQNPWFLPQEGFTGPRYEQARKARNEVLANREKRRADRLNAALVTTSAHIRNKLTTSNDKKMAARQVGIDALSWIDKKKQERWAHQQIKKNSNLSKLCPGGKGWKRVEGGHVCEVDTHAITDELLAEGKHGFYLSADRDLSKYDIQQTSIGGRSFYGPFYVMPDYKIYAADMAADRALYRGGGRG